jgi:hypothetical protein
MPPEIINLTWSHRKIVREDVGDLILYECRFTPACTAAENGHDAVQVTSPTGSPVNQLWLWQTHLIHAHHACLVQEVPPVKA